jgi:hypothetical protein
MNLPNFRLKKFLPDLFKKIFKPKVETFEPKAMKARNNKALERWKRLHDRPNLSAGFKHRIERNIIEHGGKL